MAVPGPVALGRGVVIAEHGAIPAPWMGAPVVVVGEAELKMPAEVVERLHRHWMAREPVVVALGVDPGRFRDPRHALPRHLQ